MTDPDDPDDPAGDRDDHDHEDGTTEDDDPWIEPEVTGGDETDSGETGDGDPEVETDGTDPWASDPESAGDPAGPTVERPDAAEDLEPVNDDGQEEPPEREGPLADVASDVERLRDRDPESIDPELFDEVADEAAVDREALWRQVAGEEAAERVAEMDPDLDTSGVTAPRIDPEDRTERIVEKKKYCQKCEHFSPPPEVHCTHEGTDIAELVDVDTFRVIDCPVIAEDEELERI